MKYLKIFEEFENKYYWEVPRDEWVNMLDESEPNFLESEVIELVNLFEKLGYDYTLENWRYVKTSYKDDVTRIFVDRRETIVNGDKIIYASHNSVIVKGEPEEEYFYLIDRLNCKGNYKETKYKVDQLDGLIKFFEDSNSKDYSFLLTQNESFNFSDGINPDLLTRKQFESLQRQSIHMRFSSKTTVGLTMNSRGTDININYDSKVKQHIMFYFNHSYLTAKMVFNTKFSVMKIEGDAPYIYFESSYGYRNVGTNFWNFQNHPQDQTIYGRMEVEEFDLIIANPKLWKEWMVDKTFEMDQQTHKILKESFTDIPEPERLIGDRWDEELDKMVVAKFDQRDINLFVSLSDSIPNEWKQKKSIFNYFEFTLGRHGISGLVWLCKTDDNFYLVEVWNQLSNKNTDSELYKCDGFECMEKLLRKTFDDFKEIISLRTKTNESHFDEVPEPKSLLDENGDIITGASRLHQNELEPFNNQEKLFINKLLETLNEEYISTNVSDPAQFILSMGEMGETTHYLRIIKMEDDFYQVEYINHVDSDDEYVVSECDGFKCLSKLLIRLFGKIKEDYDGGE